MEIITIKPVYGYGWMRGSSEESLPDPFKFEVLQRQEGNRIVFGRVVEASHPYFNYWILLGLRTASPEGDFFNAYVYDQKPQGMPDPRMHRPLVTGFAMLS